MNTEFIAILKNIIAKQGVSILSEPRRVNNLFADLAQDIPKPQKNAFIRCLEMDCAKILKNATEADRAKAKQQLAQKLHEDEGLDLGLCGQTLDLLAVVLCGEKVKPQQTPSPVPVTQPANPSQETANLQQSANSIKGPTGINKIDDYEFYKKGLYSVVIPNGITHIGEGAYKDNCLTSVTIPNGVTHIGKLAFADNRLTTVIIPDSVTHIGEGAFIGSDDPYGANKLTSVTIGNGVTHIGNAAFRYNYLTRVVIPDNVIHIGNAAFANNELNSVAIPNCVTHIGDYAFTNNKLKKVIIPDSVTHIGDEAFCKNELNSVTIPNGVTHIGKFAFADNPLTPVIIPDSVTHLGEGAFWINPGNLYIETSITIGSNVLMEEDHYGFAKFYQKQGRKAGIYTYLGEGLFGNYKWKYEG